MRLIGDTLGADPAGWVAVTPGRATIVDERGTAHSVPTRRKED